MVHRSWWHRQSFPFLPFPPCQNRSYFTAHDCANLSRAWAADPATTLVCFANPGAGTAAQHAAAARQTRTATVAPTYRIKWLILALLRLIQLPIPMRATGSATSVSPDTIAGSRVSRTNLLHRWSLLIQSAMPSPGLPSVHPVDALSKVQKSVRTTIHRDVVLSTELPRNFYRSKPN